MMDELRELDVQVAQALGLEVIGETWCCQDPEDPRWWTVDWEEDDINSLQPVYLAHCVCDLPKDPDPEFDFLYMTIVGGHRRGCLEVVTFYSTDIAAAMSLFPIASKRGLFLVVMAEDACGWYSADVYVDSECEMAHHHPDCQQIAKTFEELPAAICRAFLAAVGKEE